MFISKTSQANLQDWQKTRKKKARKFLLINWKKATNLIGKQTQAIKETQMANKHKKNRSPTNLISDQESLNYMRLFYVVDHIGKTFKHV